MVTSRPIISAQILGRLSELPMGWQARRSNLNLFGLGPATHTHTHTHTHPRARMKRSNFDEVCFTLGISDFKKRNA